MKLAIIGATGKVGRMMQTCLQENNIHFDELGLYASANSSGEKINFMDKDYVVQETTPDIFKKRYDFVLFSAGGSVAKEYARYAVENGSVVVDNSSAFRKDENIPLVVPEINGYLLKNYKGIIANPNCSTIQLVLLLHPLHKYTPIKKVVVTTMQSVSGSGYKGVMEMHQQRTGNSTNKLYPKKIDLNVIPQIGDINENSGYCEEESKMTFETKKILNDVNFNLIATTVRVPVVYGHSESVYIEFSDKVDIHEITGILSKSEGVDYSLNYMTPLEIGESDLSHVSRVRYAGDERSILLWNVAHNIRLGAATNAVKIVKFKIEN